MSYLSKIRFRRTPQSLPLTGQVPNSAGGHAWAVDDWTRLRRFLVLGSEGGSFYASERDADARERARQCERVHRRATAPRTVAEIVAVSRAGRAPKNDPAIFALAMAAGLGDEATRQAALAALPTSAAPARTCSTSRRSSRSSAAGAARCVARSARWYAHARPTSSRTRRSSTASATAGRTATCSASPTRARR